MKARVQAMSGAGLLVVLTMCLALAGVIATACVMSIRGDEVPEVLDRVLQGLLIGVPALLAKSYRDVPPSEQPPAPVTVVNNGEPVEVVPVVDVP